MTNYCIIMFTTFTFNNKGNGGYNFRYLCALSSQSPSFIMILFILNNGLAIFCFLVGIEDGVSGTNDMISDYLILISETFLFKNLKH